MFGDSLLDTHQLFDSYSAAISRRNFAQAGLALLATSGFPKIAFGNPSAHIVGDLPSITDGVQVGLLQNREFVVWSRADRESRMIVEWSTTPKFERVHRVKGSTALASSDYTAKTLVRDLPPNQQIFYRVLFEDLHDSKNISAPDLLPPNSTKMM